MQDDARPLIQETPEMPKFYKHNIEESRKLYYGLLNEVEKKYERRSPERSAEFVIQRLLHVIQHGLPDCYASIRDFLYDLDADFHHTKDGMMRQIQIMLDDPRIPEVFEAIQREWHYDLRAWFLKGE
jgi:hypothetical protein